MSRRYNMDITVKGLKEETHKALVETAISTQWNTSYGFMEPIEENEPSLLFQTGGEGSLCGGETEEEFAGRMAEAIWDALGYYVSVRVTATYLEDLPNETLCLEEEEYAGYLKCKEES